jgi:hypothetical protein
MSYESMSAHELARAREEAGRLHPRFDDPESRRVIAEAHAALEREQAQRYLRDGELFAAIGVKDINEMDACMPELVQAGFPFSMNGASHVQRLLVRDEKGAPVRPSAVAERYHIERWLAALDATARRLGYTKPAPKRSRW